MKSIVFLLFLCVYSITLPAQITAIYRQKADSCSKAGNLRAADSLYTLALTSQPNDKDYMSRAAVRRKLGVPCSACGDLFSASVLGNKQAVKQFRRDCYRVNKITDCARDSFTMYYTPGKIEVRQKVNNGWVLQYNTDTAFKSVHCWYLSGKDTLPLAFDTCVMPDSVKNKIVTWVSKNYVYPPPAISTVTLAAASTGGYLWGYSNSNNTCTYQLMFDATGSVIDARVINGHPTNPDYDRQVLRALRTLPPTGSWGCDSAVRVVSVQIFVTYRF